MTRELGSSSLIPPHGRAESYAIEVSGLRYRNIPTFSERSFRILAGSEDDLQAVSERLGHASTDITSKHYRSNVTKVKPFNLPIKK